MDPWIPSALYSPCQRGKYLLYQTSIYPTSSHLSLHVIIIIIVTVTNISPELAGQRSNHYWPSECFDVTRTDCFYFCVPLLFPAVLCLSLFSLLSLSMSSLSLSVSICLSLFSLSLSHTHTENTPHTCLSNNGVLFTTLRIKCTIPALSFCRFSSSRAFMVDCHVWFSFFCEVIEMESWLNRYWEADRFGRYWNSCPHRSCLSGLSLSYPSHQLSSVLGDSFPDLIHCAIRCNEEPMWIVHWKWKII